MLIPTTTSSEVPIVFREPHVNSGFRQPNQPWLYYIHSMFQRHNECINVWTHVTAVLFVLYKFWTIYETQNVFTDAYMRPLCVLFFTVFALYFCSSCAHCFQNKSEIVHYTCFMIDYCGIGLYGFGSSMVHHFYSSDFSTFDKYKDVYIGFGAVLAVIVSICCSLSKTMYSRPYPFTRRLWQVISVLAIYAWLILPIVVRILTYLQTGKYIGGLRQHSEQIVWFFLAGFFFSSDIPQRFFPGTCDFIGHSHQLFHVCIALTTVKQIDGVMGDIVSENAFIRSRPKPSIAETYGALGLVLLANLIVMVSFRAYIKGKINRNVVPRQNGIKHD